MDIPADEIDAVMRHWLALSQVLWSPRDGESVMERLAVNPWESDDPAVLAVWQRLTAPEHLLALAGLAAQPDLNPQARIYFLRAYEDCRARTDAPPSPSADATPAES